MDDLIARLEGAVTRLEAMADAGLKTEVQKARHGSLSDHERRSPEVPVSINNSSYLDFETLLYQLSGLVKAAEGIGGDVCLASGIFVDAFRREKVVVEAILRCKKPSNPSELMAILAPVAEKVSQLGDFSKNPKSVQSGEAAHPLHLRVLEEATQSLNWVAYSGPNCGLNPPPQHVEDVLGAAQFYINKIRMQYPKAAVGDEPSVHSVWTTSIMSFLSSLKQYCQKHHSTGPSWNDSSNGLDLKEFKSEINPKADGVAKQGSHSGPPPPPPPPLPSASSLTKPRAQSSENSGKKQVAALFAEINRGESITSGLRKVTDDMKSKNKKDRSGTVPNGGQSEIPSGNTASKRINQHQATQTSSPRLECEQGRKWVVENYAGEKNVQVGPANPRQSVYIFNCHDCTICIQGKVNAVTIDACMKCGVVLETVVASCEVVNSRKIEVQATGLMPTVCIDSTDGCRLYLTKAAALETDITSSKSSEMNVVILGDMETEDVEECPLPEHYVSKYKGPGKGFVTEPVVHGA